MVKILKNLSRSADDASNILKAQAKQPAHYHFWLVSQLEKLWVDLTKTQLSRSKNRWGGPGTFNGIEFIREVISEVEDISSERADYLLMEYKRYKSQEISLGLKSRS